MSNVQTRHLLARFRSSRLSRPWSIQKPHRTMASFTSGRATEAAGDAETLFGTPELGVGVGPGGSNRLYDPP
jgi:hypothetical protein